MGHTVPTYSTTIGPEYIPIAFETAAQFDPEVKLYYHDYNIEFPSDKTTATIVTLKLVQSLIDSGTKTDSVGLQAHFIVGGTPSLDVQTANLESFTALGVEVAYTEVDIRHGSLPADDVALAKQAVENYVGVTIWDFADEYSWIPGNYPGSGDMCLWDADLATNPAYDAIVTLLSPATNATVAHRCARGSGTRRMGRTPMLIRHCLRSAPVEETLAIQ